MSVYCFLNCPDVRINPNHFFDFAEKSEVFHYQKVSSESVKNDRIHVLEMRGNIFMGSNRNVSSTACNNYLTLKTFTIFLITPCKFYWKELKKEYPGYYMYCAWKTFGKNKFIQGSQVAVSLQYFFLMI